MVHGASVSEAIAKALGCSLAEFGRRIGKRQAEIYMCLNGYEQRVYAEIRDAICAELEIPREYLDRLIDTQHESTAASA
jgi:hypothetical protein